MEKYLNRTEAGKYLAKHLKAYANRKDVIVLALPRGGVPVAYEVAKKLSLPLDVFIVRKLGVPWHEELAFGALAVGDALFINQELIENMRLSPADIDQVIASEQKELKRRVISYRGKKPFPNLKNKTVILVDDGIATGATMRAAITALRKMHPASIVVAVPVAAKETCDEMSDIADDLVCPLQPENFYAVGAWYEVFDQTLDAEVHKLLAKP